MEGTVVRTLDLTFNLWIIRTKALSDCCCWKCSWKSISVWLWLQGDPGCPGKSGEPGHQGCLGQKGTKATHHHDYLNKKLLFIQNKDKDFYCPGCWFKFVFQVIKETLLFVLVYLETRGLLEILGPQVMIWFCRSNLIFLKICYRVFTNSVFVVL